MKAKSILIIAAGLSLVGITPKLLKNQIVAWEVLICYFFYIAFCFLSFYAINKFLWTARTHNTHKTRFAIGLGLGLIYLLLVHLLLFRVQPGLLVHFLALKNTAFFNIFIVTAFRAFIVQSIAFACLFFFESKNEKTVFQQEISHLNLHLNSLRNTQIQRKEYKSILITRFQNKVIPVDTSEIAFFRLSGGIVYQWQFSGGHYIQNLSLERLENDLDPATFFRANRQFLINRKAVEKVEQAANRKLKVVLRALLDEEILISKEKATTFVRWLEQQPVSVSA